MKLLLLILVALAMYVTPLYVYDHMVMPQLRALQGQYEQASTVAETIAQGQ